MSESSGIERVLKISNVRGLHARAAAKFVWVLNEFDADVTVSRDDVTVDGRSIMGLLLLVAGRGTTIRLRAKGRDAEAALDALAGLVDAQFYEE
mgnify:CR=1 FL=1